MSPNFVWLFYSHENFLSALSLGTKMVEILSHDMHRNAESISLSISQGWQNVFDIRNWLQDQTQTDANGYIGTGSSNSIASNIILSESKNICLWPRMLLYCYTRLYLRALIFSFFSYFPNQRIKLKSVCAVSVKFPKYDQ